MALASIGHLGIIYPSFVAASDGDPEGGQIDSSLISVKSTVDGFLFPVISRPTSHGVNRQFKKAFYYNSSTKSLTSAKIWIQSQEHSPQIKIALEKDVGGAILLDGSDLTDSPASIPDNLTLTDFTLAAGSLNGLLVGGDGALPANSAQGFWAMQVIDENLVSDGSVPFTIGYNATQ